MTDQPVDQAPIDQKPPTTTSLVINLHSVRSAKARFAVLVSSKSMMALLIATSVLLAACGLTLALVTSTSLGWVIAGLAGPILAFVAWVRAELVELAFDPASTTVDARLDGLLLGQITDQTTPKQLASIIMHQPGGQFFAMRFGIGFPVLEQIASDKPADIVAVWDAAEKLRAEFGRKYLDASILTVALLQCSTESPAGLARLKLDMDDMRRGISWYAHTVDLMDATRRRPRAGGGIGRDWSFGFTPLLSRFGANISEQVAYNGLLHRELEGHAQTINQMFTVLAQASRHNVALIGPFGSGKTTLVQAFAERLWQGGSDVPQLLRFHQVIGLDPSSLISQASGRGELESLVQHLCYEALKSKNCILFFDDAQLFFEEGQGSVNLSNILLPVLEGGAVRIVFAMDDQHWQRIQQQNTALTQYLNRITVQPATKEETLLVLQDQLLLLEYRHKVLITYQALEATYDLSSRYMNDQAMPGKALKLLESAVQLANGGLVTRQSVESAIEQTQGVKVSTASASDERTTLLHLEDLIHERMINQTRAVRVVSDALRRARAGVRATNRPIGTFLFLGPTGVGKTELARSLAAVYFGGENHMVRIDLNEYVQPGDVGRLLADAASTPNSLVAQISRQPFSVVLLDEIEKAHDSVLSMLLQLLDEGVLRDVNNREVSFRDAIIIATSNAGAERIRQHIDAGEQLEQFEQQFTNELISAGEFRPEFLNRFDEIVLFRPLTPDELLQVIDLILIELNKNLANQKVSVSLDDDAKRLLVQAGYDPRLGARPMRRVVQKTVESLVAKQLLSGQTQPGDQIHFVRQDVAVALES